jgi:hypothetical protein
MAKSIKFSFSGASFMASVEKVDRDKVYGYVEEEILDSSGKVCTYGNLLEDGRTIFLPGATALKVVNEKNEEMNKAELKTVYLDGTPAVLVPAVSETGASLETASLEDLFDLEVGSVYQLEFESLDERKKAEAMLSGDKLYRFTFNYRSDYEGADAILLASEAGIFVLTGHSVTFEYQANSTLQFTELEPEPSTEEEEMDFGML